MKKDIRPVYIEKHSARLCETPRVGFLSNVVRHAEDWTEFPEKPNDVLRAVDRNGHCCLEIITAVDSQELVLKGPKGEVLSTYLSDYGTCIFSNCDGQVREIEPVDAVKEVLRKIHQINEEYSN